MAPRPHAPLLLAALLLAAAALMAAQGFIVPAPCPSVRRYPASRRVFPLRAFAAPSNSGSSGRSPAGPPKRRGGSNSNRRGGGGGGSRDPSTVIEFSMRRAGYTPAIDLLEAALGAGTAPEECEEGLFAAAIRVGCGVGFWSG